jgi:hypothetical protein
VKVLTGAALRLEHEEDGKANPMTHDPIGLLLEHGDDHGCVHLTELRELAQKLELDDEDVEALVERFESHGIELTDDCSRALDEPVPYTNDQIAAATNRPRTCSSTQTCDSSSRSRSATRGTV